MNMEGAGQIATETQPTFKSPETAGEKSGAAEEILVPLFNEHMSPDNVLEYMMGKKKASFDGLGERIN
jgi:hypothetical protein